MRGYAAQQRVPTLYYMDTLGGTNFIPEEYVDITDTLETKVQALLCHRSQVKWLKDHDNMDVTEFARNLAATRGQQCSVPYAEGFQVAKLWPRLRTERLLP